MHTHRITWKNELPSMNSVFHSASRIGNALCVSVACGRYHVCSQGDKANRALAAGGESRVGSGGKKTDLRGGKLCLLVPQLVLLLVREHLQGDMKPVSIRLARRESRSKAETYRHEVWVDQRVGQVVLILCNSTEMTDGLVSTDLGPRYGQE